MGRTRRRGHGASASFLPFLVLAVLALPAGVAACSAGDARPEPVAQGAPADRSVTTTAARADTPAFSGRVDVGGATVQVECSGTGTPTVVFESGDESGASQWRAVLPAVTATTRACAYDRLGVGTSDPAQGCRGAADLRKVLEAALRGAGAQPPYVLVGSSGGGYLVVNYALAHRDQVRALVLVDTFPAIDLATASPQLRQELRCDSATNRERRDYAAVEHAAWDHRVRLPQLWVTVVSNDYGLSATNEQERSAVTSQRGWFALNPNRARQLVVESGHDVPGNEPGAVADEVVRAVAVIRSS